MGALVRFASIPGLVAALSLCRASSAWAGDGSSLPVAQIALDSACATAHISAANCPQLPTINQVVVEIAALLGISQNQARDMAIVPSGFAIDGGGPAPVAFISPPEKGSVPIVTQPNDPAANAFISARTSPIPDPKSLNFTFSYLPRTNPVFAADQFVGDIVLPFIETADGNNLGLVSGVLLITGTGGTTVNANVVADLLQTGTPQLYPLSQLGMGLTLDFSSGHEVLNLTAPLLIPPELQPAYSFDASGVEFDPVNAPNVFEGIDPVASFLDASLASDVNDPFAIHVDLAIAKDGRTVLSSPLLQAPVPEPTTIALLGGGLLVLGFLRRRGAPISR